MDDNCGGSNELKETDTKQCIKLPHYVYCSEFTIDEDCKVEVESNTHKCTNRVDFNSSKYICDWNQERTSCTRRNRDCSDQNLENCEGFDANCKKVYRGDAIPVCNIVTIESTKCNLNNGNCVNGEGLESYEECGFNEDYSKCQVKNKQCNKIISNSEHCNKGTIINIGAECLHLALLSTYCTEVITNPSCKIENGECKYQDTKSTTKACKFDNYDSMLKCEFYEKDEKCNTGDNFNTCENGDDVPDEQICAPMGDTKCKLRPIECSDYKDQKSCEENTIIKGTKKCSWVTNFGGGSCKEYVVDNIEQNPAWSDEDIRAIDRACVALRAYANGELPNFLPSELLGYADKLQSLISQNRWKPSDEQMNTLEYYMHTLVCNEHKKILFGLYADLKKLMKE
jgi:hypothetical protein